MKMNTNTLQEVAFNEAFRIYEDKERFVCITKHGNVVCHTGSLVAAMQLAVALLKL